MKFFEGWRHRTAWLVATGVVAAVFLAAVVDFGVLEYHRHSGPRMVDATGCAGHPQGGTPTDPQVGLSAWTSFDGALGNSESVQPSQNFSASWRFTTGSPVVTAPAVANGVVYVGSMDTCAYALDAKTGKLLWSFAANNQLMSQPLVADGRVYLASGNKGFVSDIRGTGQNGIYALNAATGREEWFFPTVGENMPTPTYDNGVIYEAGGGKIFYAINAVTGKLLWDVPDGAIDSMSSPKIVGNIAVFGQCLPCQVSGINIQTHQVAWTLPLPQAGSGVDDNTPAVSGNTVYMQAPEGAVFKQIVEMAIDASTGQVVWQRVLGTDTLNAAQRAAGNGELKSLGGEEVGVASVVGNRLYAGTPGIPDLWALNATTGQVLWQTSLRQAVRTPPLVQGQTIYATGNSTLFQLSAATGALVQARTYNAFVEGSGIMVPCTTAPPAIVGHTLFLAGSNNGSTITAAPLGAAQ